MIDPSLVIGWILLITWSTAAIPGLIVYLLRRDSWK